MHGDGVAEVGKGKPSAAQGEPCRPGEEGRQLDRRQEAQASPAILQKLPEQALVAQPVQREPVGRTV